MGELGTDNTGVACRVRSQPAPGSFFFIRDVVVFTVRASDLAPDHADLGAADLLLAPVDIGDLLAEVEARSRVSKPYARVRWSFGKTYLAAAVSSTPSILIRLVSGWVFRRPR